MPMAPNSKLIMWYHDRIEIDTSYSVMAVTPQTTPKCHHKLGCASVVVTFGSLWCHSHDLKLGINSFNHELISSLINLMSRLTLVNFDLKTAYHQFPV